VTDAPLAGSEGPPPQNRAVAYAWERYRAARLSGDTVTEQAYDRQTLAAAGDPASAAFPPSNEHVFQIVRYAVVAAALVVTLLLAVRRREREFQRFRDGFVARPPAHVVGETPGAREVRRRQLPYDRRDGIGGVLPARPAAAGVLVHRPTGVGEQHPVRRRLRRRARQWRERVENGPGIPARRARARAADDDERSAEVADVLHQAIARGLRERRRGDVVQHDY
jgi:hypothetical protein